MIVECPKCSVQFENETKWGPKKFCSRACANTRTHTQDTKKKISKSLKGREGIKGRNTMKSLTPDQLEKWKDSHAKSWRTKFESTPFDKLSLDLKRRRVNEEQNNACARCGLSEWQGFPISLELDHKDGDRKNNTRENLELLCPNCHSITPTWRGRNKRQIVSNEVLLEALLTEKNIRQALEKVGMSPRGKNYERAKRLLEVST